MGMWGNFSKDEDEENLDQITSTEEKEPIKLIDSVNTLTALVNRQKELSAEILSGIDKEQSLSKQLSTLNLDELNKAASKETTYKTEEEYFNYLDYFLSNDIKKDEKIYKQSGLNRELKNSKGELKDCSYKYLKIMIIFALRKL